MDWTDETNIMFIERIRDFPCLWNIHHQDKKNRVKIAHAYKTLAKELVVDVATLKRRKENIFQTYRNYKRKVARSRTNPNREREVYQPSWPMYSHLDDFLHSVYTPKGPVSSMKEEAHVEVDYHTLDDPDQQYDDDDEFIEPDHLETASHHSGSPSSKIRKTGSTTDNSCSNAMLKQVKELSKKMLQKTRYNSSTPTKDECSIYGELVAVRLRKMDETQRQFAMYEMDNVFYNITLGMSLSRTDQMVYPSPYNVEITSPSHHSLLGVESSEGSVTPLTPKVLLDVDEEHALEEPI